ncbi:MAG TPA: hypothetical protein VLL08_14150 [Kineosporiaceae bacterium]|nr:hypothetical protein [Kineosporiaceae bacterium]
MTPSDDTFTRATSTVADFDSPFYAEERQRDVWNEASAVGFQSMLWGGLGLACAMTWIGGEPQVGWAMGLLALIAAASWLTVIHANRLGVTGRENVRLNRPRTYLFAALYLSTLVGMVVRSDVEVSPSSIAGLVVGVALVLVGIVVAGRRNQSGD